MLVTAPNRCDAAVRQAGPLLSSSSLLTIHISLGQEYLGSFVVPQPTDEANSFSLLEEGFSDDRKERIYHTLWNATLGGCLVLATMARRPTRILELGLGSTGFLCDIVRRNPKISVSTINYFDSRCPTTLPADLANPPRIISRNLELGNWGHDSFLHSTQDLVAARFEADGLDWNWRHIVEQSLAALKPGGWLELQIVGPLTSDDGSVDGTALGAIPRHLAKNHEGADRSGVAPVHAEVLANAGFEEVTVVNRRWWSSPVDHRADVDEVEARLAGMYLAEAEAAQLLEAQCEEIRTYLRWTPEEADGFLRTVRAEIEDPSIQAYFPVYVVYGRKPFT